MSLVIADHPELAFTFHVYILVSWLVPRHVLKVLAYPCFWRQLPAGFWFGGNMALEQWAV